MLEERHFAQNKKFRELIVFVHHYGGSKVTLRRHIEFVNELGFDAISFNLSVRRITDLRKIPFGKNKKIGIRHVWQKDIENILDKYDEDKILYSLSFPSISALTAIADRNTKDIRAWVCDGGPFFKIQRNVWNYFTYATPIKNRLARAAVTALNVFVWGQSDYKKDALNAIQELPKDFPVLSIRGWKDRLVSPTSIEEVFKDGDHLELEVFAIPEADHLVGLKEQPDLYLPRVSQFLKKVAKPD